MTQVFVLNSAYGLMTAVAAMDAGAIPASGSGRILVTVNAAIIPEAADGIDTAAHLATLRARFDRVVDLNELLAPERPPHWRVSGGEAPVLERLLRQAWRIGDGEVHLYLQSPQVAPSRVFIDIFAGAPVTIVGDGLMTYSPIRNRWPHSVAGRVVGVVYADTVPGVAPLLFAESGAARIPVPPPALRAVVGEVADATADPAIDALTGLPRPALVLGQYLAALKLISVEEELQMQREMIDAAMRWRPSAIVFKPHPSAAPSVIDELADHARVRGVAFEVFRGTTPAEVLALRLPFVGAVAGFSTALPTLQALNGSPIAAVGTELLLQRLTPYENGNRIPVTIIDALTRADSPYRGERMQELVDAVGYAMQPLIADHLRPRAEAFLTSAPTRERERYFAQARLTSLQLPGGGRPGLLARVTARRDGASRITEATLAVRGAQRRSRRAWKALRGG
ncbi:alpha-2,8-polysialyltransferase family protein [Microbacterium sp. EYE_5]|uniref:alpha-2,8-polysialyltransferase family protein n=1 Tax=unclassified Microbacterium TaxID=2609290 RepID=UPI0020038EA3|nr:MULTISPECIES: alpha-2,8-polysialyltransferase family protein [unclassified Microbacterium]MCK6079566.1 alpha-2,8-polysialyltransferase family protein [Microbacterium sp. EYE_382]MCK6084837.1 alpha-2,8-polysialyltransferase family protein [Microbacterium sp. EYE_384]MCK6122937.1 alpha-2,8-polysialyltransferase family protein [Microbacterium sp. EYE_80]MCK6125600.1 alpha-2,8-polysialyltransferase family protein [Microbacterium sp. EYE_79]MCK6140521.1 alpha-2,8-polysialyltransferase family pro